MGHIRLVEDVAVVDWDPRHLPELVGELRAHIDQHHGRKVALNLTRAELRSDDIETLAEAAVVCRDRGCPIGLFALGDDLARFLDVVGLAPDLPPVLGAREDEAVAAIKKDGVGLRPAGRPPAPPPTPPPSPEVELTGAVTERFDPISDAAEVGPPAAVRAATAAAEAGEQPTDELLAINWADLSRTGYAIGGPGGERLRAEAARAAPTPKRAAPPEDDVIDLDEPTRGQGKKRDRVQKTEVLPAFKVDEQQPPSGTDWSARPAAASLTGLRDEETRIGPEDYSPVDSGSTPPAFLSQTADPPVSRTAPTQTNKRPPPKPARPGPPPRPTPPPRTPTEAPAAASAPTPYYEADDGDEQTVMFQATVPLPAGGPLPNTAGSDSGEQFVDSDDQMVMFQPGAQDLALLAQISAQVAPPEPVSPSRAVPAPPAARAADPSARAAPPEEDEEQLSHDETIMFQPGALDAALLAEVAAAAGPETHIPPPSVAEPPEPEMPPVQMPDGRDLELRLFVHDYAIVTETHLSLLDRFLRAGEETLAPQELQPPDGRQNGDRTPPQALAGIVDQFVHSKLVRRTRSPRARGGTGFVFAPSPQVRGVVVRLVKLWQSSRPKVMTWLNEEKKA